MGDHAMETRRRSRSKTPFLRSSCDHENCEHAGLEGHVHHKKKAAVSPNVHTIIEETSEVTSSSQPTKFKANAAMEQRKSSSTKVIESTTYIETSKKVNNTLPSGGVAATSTPKSTEANRAKEVAQNEFNAEYERLQQQNASNSFNSSGAVNKSNISFNSFVGRFFNNSNNSATNADELNNGNISTNVGYREYKRIGDYANKTPKTDYTYSELSPHRRILAAGQVAMPNMSRRSLEHHGDRVNYMVQRNPSDEAYIRQRYESRYAENSRETARLLYDSSDEVDEVAQKKSYYNLGSGQGLLHSSQSWFQRIITTITTTFHTITGRRAAESDSHILYRTGFAQKRGVFGFIGHAAAAVPVGIFRYLYAFITSVLCLDAILLQSSNAENRQKKRFLLLLLILLPLLLLTGLYYYLHPNEPFPPKSFSEYTFTLPPLPEFPTINVSQYINEEKYEAIKLETYNRLNDFRDWTDDYLLYLKTVSQNIADEGRRLFRREEHFERV